MQFYDYIYTDIFAAVQWTPVVFSPCPEKFIILCICKIYFTFVADNQTSAIFSIYMYLFFPVRN